MLSTNKTLEVVKVGFNPFNNDGMKDLARSLKFNSTLKRFYLDKMVRGDAAGSDKVSRLAERLVIYIYINKS